MTLLGLTTALSQELGNYGIRVNAIVPGYIETDMTQGEIPVCFPFCICSESLQAT
jgi:NAD(P)-dependent dehydrogenase (short-subunit alcohol dehydrogenase family)